MKKKYENPCKKMEKKVTQLPYDVTERFAGTIYR
jgi:hypothetical protein